MTRYDLILLFALLSGTYYVWDEATAPRPEDAPDHLPVLFSVDASPQTAAGLVQGLIKGQPSWCHVPVGARQAWDFALVDTELGGEDATAVYRLTLHYYTGPSGPVPYQVQAVPAWRWVQNHHITS